MNIHHGHLSFRPGFARSAGRTGTAAAAYRAGIDIADARTGEQHDYSRKGGVEFSAIVVPSNAQQDIRDLADQSGSEDKAEAARGAAAFWNQNERAHTRGDATVARELVADLPRELSVDERREVAEEFAREFANRYGVGVQYSIHQPRKISDAEMELSPNQTRFEDGTNGNWHVHFLFTTKEINAHGFGKKVNELDPEACRIRKLEAPVVWARAEWASRVQTRLQERGVDKEYTLGSHAAERARLVREGRYADAARLGEPTVHRGPSQTHAATHPGPEREQANVEDVDAARKPEQTPTALGARAVERLGERESTFTVVDLKREILREAGSRQLGEDLDAATVAALGREDVLAVGERVSRRGETQIVFSTRTAIERERQMADTVLAREGEGRHMVNVAVVSAQAERHGLSAEQRLAVEHATGADGVALIEGMAGAGKTTAMRATREAFEAAGYRVQGVALAAEAARKLEAEGGISSGTIARFLGQVERGQAGLDSRTVLVVDEAGMVGSRQMAELVEATRASGSKLVLVGDSKQLQPIEAGGAFKALRDQVGAVELTEIRRQRDVEQVQTVRDLAQGDARTALADMAERGQIRVERNADAVRTRMAADWHASRREGVETVMLAGTRAEVADLNRLARERRIEAGEIERGVEVTVATGRIELAQGDEIVFSKNDRRLGVTNGTRAEIVGLRVGEAGAAIVARTNDGREIALHTQEYNNIQHGYATTVHKSQGQSVERAYWLAGSMFDRELSYVAGSRHRGETAAYIDAETYPESAHLARQMERSHAKGTTLDYAPFEHAADAKKAEQEKHQTGLEAWRAARTPAHDANRERSSVMQTETPGGGLDAWRKTREANLSPEQRKAEQDAQPPQRTHEPEM